MPPSQNRASSETLSQLPDYTTGGSVHVIINNQLDSQQIHYFAEFSTPQSAATDWGTSIHVNGDDVDNVVCLWTRSHNRVHMIASLMSFATAGKI